VNLNDPVATALLAAEALDRADHRYAPMGGLLDFALVDREVEALAAEIPDWDVRSRWAAVRARGGV
jgi:hypothetical protein